MYEQLSDPTIGICDRILENWPIKSLNRIYYFVLPSKLLVGGFVVIQAAD